MSEKVFFKVKCDGQRLQHRIFAKKSYLRGLFRGQAATPCFERVGKTAFCADTVLLGHVLLKPASDRVDRFVGLHDHVKVVDYPTGVGQGLTDTSLERSVHVRSTPIKPFHGPASS